MVHLSTDARAAVPASARRRTSTSAPRAPSQARGRRRVDAILDAAAALVTEVGPAGVTVQAIAERARTSKGSLYHFFPDREGVLRALLDRHVAALRALADAARPPAGEDWTRLDAEEVVDRVVTPFLRYVDGHPDLRLVLHDGGRLERDRAEMRAIVVGIADAALRAWDPAARPAERAARAATMIAVLGGVLDFTQRASHPPAATMRREMRRALAAYLRA